MQTPRPAPADNPPPDAPEIPTPTDDVPVTAADKVAYTFYGAAALTALVGQVWAAVIHISWPEHPALPIWARVALVAPAVAVIELGGVATSGLADVRRRKGENAYAYRAMSAFAAVVAVVFNLVGHWETPYLAFGFAGLSAFAYALWLAHSAARRRDALRRARKMAETAPVYGVMQWIREPEVTRLARTLALQRKLGLFESLDAAREELRTRDRRKAIAESVAELIKAEQKNPLRAKIAATTYDMDRLAREIEARADYAGWADAIGQSLQPTSTGSPRREAPPLRVPVTVERAAEPDPEPSGIEGPSGIGQLPPAPIGHGESGPGTSDRASGTNGHVPGIGHGMLSGTAGRALPAGHQPDPFGEPGTNGRALPAPTALGQSGTGDPDRAERWSVRLGANGRRPVTLPRPRIQPAAPAVVDDQGEAESPGDPQGMTAAEKREAAQRRYRESVRSGQPLSGAELARMFGVTDPKWGTRQIQKVRSEAEAADQDEQEDQQR